MTAVWALGFVAHGTLWLAGGHLDRPASRSLGDLEAWYRTVDPGEAAAVTAWMAGVAISGWLAAALALQGLAALPGGACLRPVADLVSPRSVQRLGRNLAGLSLTAGLVAAPSASHLAVASSDPPPVSDGTPASADLEVPGTATMSRLDDVETSTVPTVVSPSTSSTPVTPTSVDPPAIEADGPDDGRPPAGPAGPGPANEAGVPSAPPADASAPSRPTDDLPHPPAPPAVAVSGQPSPSSNEQAQGEAVVVEPGMSFWSIAAEAMADVGLPTDDASVARYWRRVIDANRDRLVAPANPDLLLPGQVLVLPPP